MAQRPEGSRMLRDARAGAFDLVLVHRMDRVGRDLRFVPYVRNELQSLGISIRSITEPVYMVRLEGLL